MEKHCTMVYFTLRKNRPNKEGKCPIQLSISTNGERIYVTTGKSCHPNNWNENKQTVKGKSEEDRLLNDYLQQLRNKVYQKEVELNQRGYLVTPALLKDAIYNKVECLNEKTLMSVVREHNDMKKQLVGKTIAEDTYYCFELAARYIMEFMQAKYNMTDILLRDVKLGFIQNFHTFLLSEKKNRQNTCSKHLKFLKQVLNYAVANGYLQYNTLNTYKIERDPVAIDFLDAAELNRIINFETIIPRYQKARDAFLFGCFTGLAYVDIKTLRPEHFEKDADGRIWIKKKRVKTGILSRIPLLPMAKLLLEKYNGTKEGVVFPIQDPTDINEYLKDIALLCNINKRITFHTSRHTFASTVTLANNISLEVVSKMMGHSNTRMTSHYAKLIDKAIGEQMDKIMDTFNTSQTNID